MRIGVQAGDGEAARRRAGRLCEAANPGQVLLGAAAAATLPGDVALDDLGVRRLRDLGPPERIHALRVDGAAPVPPRTLDATPNNLPVQPTSFVGRRGELARLGELLAAARLVTVTGPGGCGKTRLALHAAAEQAGRWPGGVWWVDLAAADDPAQVAELAATAADVLVEPVQGPLRSLVAQLAERRALLCLDNCEHLRDGVAALAEAVVAACPEVALLATSRMPLEVGGEAVHELEPLAAEEAVALFAERAAAVRAGATLDAAESAAVRTLCARLDGIPLALELAAAWLRTLTPRQIEQGLDDRFALLVRGARGAAPRQQTLLASVEWSHELLGEHERIVLRRLAVFPGELPLEAARAVCAGGEVAASDVTLALARLVDSSLLVARHDGGEARYRLLETIRAYAAGRLDEAGEADAVRDRLLDWALAFAERLAPLVEHDKDAWRERMEAEHDAIRAALGWGLSSGAASRARGPSGGAAVADAAGDSAAGERGTRGRRLAAELPWLWHLGRHGKEGGAVLRAAVALAPTDRSPLQARLLWGVALVADTSEPLDVEYDAAQRALELAEEHDDGRLRARCLLLAAVGQFYTDFDAALELAAAARAAAEVVGDAFARDAARGLEGIVLHLRDRHDEADPLLADAASALLARGDRGIAATLLAFRAHGALFRGMVEPAAAAAQEAVAAATPLADHLRVGMARCALATVLGARGEDALPTLDPVVRLIESAGDAGVWVPGLARALGLLELRRDEPAAARDWLLREAASTDRGRPTYLAALALGPLAAAQRRLGDHAGAAATAARAVELADALGMPRVRAEALHEQALLLAADDVGAALQRCHEALALAVEHDLRALWPDALDTLAALVDAEQGARLLAAADATRATLLLPRDATAARDRDALATRLEAALGVEAFAEASAQAAALGPAEAVAFARRARGSRARPLGGWGSLTPTEREVVQLAVEGCTNPEIGARLFMSRSTVKTHLSHVYAKLGVANRTELATLAAAVADA